MERRQRDRADQRERRNRVQLARHAAHLGTHPRQNATRRPNDGTSVPQPHAEEPHPQSETELWREENSLVPERYCPYCLDPLINQSQNQH